ncbi:transposase [Streptomyces sp. NEAU-S7GS2]|uniref:transposase n=1 Tax=Streptomyces sp. NEAU-S7GS2 TaxID=2202000 RepID=UPI0023B84C70|nr:transposase [Streptomyces sp. NEAU-S7GS2]
MPAGPRPRRRGPAAGPHPRPDGHRRPRRDCRGAGCADRGSGERGPPAPGRAVADATTREAPASRAVHAVREGWARSSGPGPQVGVFLACAAGGGRTLIDRRLYLPASWTDDRERCQKAGVDDGVGFETKVVIAYCPAGTTLDELIQVAGSRWAVEECFRTAKNECGLDDYQVRRYPGWHRHITLPMAAHACLSVLRARELDVGKVEADLPSPSTSASPRSDA